MKFSYFSDSQNQIGVIFLSKQTCKLNRHWSWLKMTCVKFREKVLNVHTFDDNTICHLYLYFANKQLNYSQIYFPYNTDKCVWPPDVEHKICYIINGNATLNFIRRHLLILYQSRRQIKALLCNFTNFTKCFHLGSFLIHVN